MRRYKLEQQQRELEREIRKAKRRAEGFTDPENKAMAQAQLKQKQKELQEFIDKTNADEGAEVLRRDYEREKVYDDTVNKNVVDNDGKSGIIELRDISSRNLPNGLRTEPSHILTDDEINSLKEDISAIEADESVFKFNVGSRTGYDDVLDEIHIKGDILPDLNSVHPRDRMSARAALAHEYYGHRAYRGTNIPKGAWNDEFRASYMAAKNCPNLSDDERRDLVLDALERAKEGGISIKHNDFIRRTVYGY